MGNTMYDLKPGTFAHKCIYNAYRKKYHIMPIMPLICQRFIDFSELGDDNIIGIYASYISGHDNESILTCPPERIAAYIESQYSSGKYVVFDNCQEGGVDMVISRIYACIKLTSVPLSSVYFIVGAYNVQEVYDNYCVRNNITEKLNVYYANPWECTPYTPYMAPTYTVGKKEKLFLSFNRITRAHRVALVSLLLDAGLVDRAYYSFFADADHGNNPVCVENLITYYISNTQLRERVINAYSTNINRFPLLLNIDKSKNKTYVDADDEKYFADSYFSLVTETFFFDTFTEALNEHHDNAIFFSEKIYKPIFMKHPFVLVGRPHSLPALRNSGYRTFSPFIDETYDTIEDNAERLKAIVEEVKRLSTKTDEEWIEWQINVAEIVNHNYRTLTDRVYNLTREKVKKL
jgi:hypothetical protein